MLMRSLLLAVFLASPALAGLSPESVAVVVNGDSWASLAVANEYARLRHIPPENFIILTGLSAFDSTDVEHFRAEVLVPVFAALDQRGLTPQIDCITYSLDVPCSVAVSSDMAGKPFPQIITPVASANGLTYLHEWVRRKDPDYLRLDINRYCRRTLPLVAGEPLSAEERGEYQRGMKLYDEKKYDEAAAVIRSLTRVPRADPTLLYNLACCLALGGKADDAMTALRDAVAHGWRNHGQTSSDPDLASLVKRDDFQTLVAGMKAAQIEVQPTRGFRASYGWSDAGEPAAGGNTASGDPRYMLSTMLGVTSGRANSVAEVLECLRRSAAADGAAPRGTVYFMKNGDVRSTTRDWAFPFAMEQLRKLGVACVIEDGVLPASHADVAGAVVGIANFRWADCKSTILPGAICEHLTSCGGMMGERDGQTPCTDLIRVGAAGTSGAVTEPFALQEKFPSAFMHLHYARGSTLAEAFYQSLYGPYQLLIIGDPLCRPWGREAPISVPSISRGATPPLVRASTSRPAQTPAATLRGRVELRPTAGDEAQAVAEFALFVDGRRMAGAAAGSPLVFDTTALQDGQHTLAIVARFGDALESCARFEQVIHVGNTGRAVHVTAAPPASVAYGERTTLEVECPGAEAVDVLHLGRVVASIDQAQGTISIDTKKLGTGPVTLQPVARYARQASRVRGPYVALEVTPPAAIAVKPPPAKAKMEKGLSLSIAGGRPVPVLDTFSGDWLAKGIAAAVQPAASGDKPAARKQNATADKSFVVAGYFTVDKADLYQVQVRTNTHARIEVSGRRIALPSDGAWQFGLANLAAGTHSLRVTGKAVSDAQLDLRIGAQGTAHPSEARFTYESR
ncbi:MAG: hypothetical protein CHACPFDD_00262 [Phycisphaerae bacterium]|nr:hypothetical protein [Phycisphaerae bacterium]